jgi:prepilin-type N-terminal cleavage/methylation domain-containing protein
MKHLWQQEGYSLVEVLTSVLIIGIVAVFAFQISSQLNRINTVKKSDDWQVLHDVYHQLRDERSVALADTIRRKNYAYRFETTRRHDGYMRGKLILNNLRNNREVSIECAIPVPSAATY